MPDIPGVDLDDVDREDVYGVGREIVGVAAQSDAVAEKVARGLWKKALSRYSPAQAQAVILNGESIVRTFDAQRIYELMSESVQANLLEWIHAEDDGPGVWIQKDRPDLWVTIQGTPGGEAWFQDEVEDFEAIIKRGETVTDRPPVSRESLAADGD